MQLGILQGEDGAHPGGAPAQCARRVSHAFVKLPTTQATDEVRLDAVARLVVNPPFDVTVPLFLGKSVYHKFHPS
jgi:hypothetical protein